MNAYTAAGLCIAIAIAITGCRARNAATESNVPPTSPIAAEAQGDREMREESAPQRRVLINDRPLSDEQLQQLERAYGMPIANGSYWYDRMTGAWGLPGGPTSGFVHPNLNIGGTLRADASHGDTGVFINGRELHRIDLQGLQRLGPVLRGRWWMDAAGNFGGENGAWLGNIWHAARQSGALNSNHGGNAWVAYGKYGSGAIGSDATGQMFANFGDLSWPP